MATIIIALGTASEVQAQVAATVPRDDLWAPNKNVAAAREHNGKLYITGSFTKIGEPTGGFDVTNPITGAPIEGLGSIDGEIEVVEPDGAGGWWVGGRIRFAHGELRGGVVHILQDGTLSPWNPGLSTSVTVLDIAPHGRNVYLSGSFGVLRVDALTGQQLPWSPNFDINPNTFEVADDMLIVAGHFSFVDGQPREGLAAFAAPTGALLAWNPIAEGTLATAHVEGGLVYIAGQFSLPKAPLQLQGRVATVDILTGAATGLDVQVNGGIVEMIAVSGPTMFVGGSFTEVAGVARSRVAAVDIASGSITNWAPVLTASGGGIPRVHGLSADGQNVYLVGEFEKVDGLDVSGAVSFDIATGVRRAWDPRLGSTSARDVFSTGQVVAIGGSFKVVNTVDRKHVAAIDLSSGLPTTFHPVIGPNETAILPAGDSIYIGTRLYNAETGDLDADFAPTIADFVSRLYRVDETLYAVGSGAGGSGIFAMDASSGAFRWNLVGPSRVNNLTGSPDGRFLYIAGGFGSVGGNLTRNGIAEIDTMKHEFTDWSPALSRGATGVIAMDTRVFVSGDFRTVENRAQRGLAVFDVTDEKTRTLSPYDPRLDDSVGAMVAHGELVYLWGSFRNIGTGWREGVAAVHNSTATLCTWEVNGASRWSPFPDAGPNTLAFRSDSVIHGTLYRPFLAVFDILPGQVCK
jgi:PQQ-like domain